MKKIIGILFLLLLISCQSPGGNDDGVVEDNPQLQHSNWSIDVIAENLSIPWDVNKVVDTFFITEREGFIVEVKDNRLERFPVVTSDPIVHIGEGGLLGMALSEDFTKTEEVFLYYTYEVNNELWNKVVLAKRKDGRWLETEVLLDEIPGDRIHNGGRMAIGPDGYLYVTTGDAAVPDLSQDKNSLAGSVLRMTLDGGVPDDNPFANSYIYTYGHRNPQGLAWNEEGELFSSEHGPTAHDELNSLKAGNNYGWPEIIGDETEEGMEQPVVHSGNDTWAPSGMAFLEERLFVTGLRGESLFMWMEDSQVFETVLTGEGRLRDVIEHEGILYIITNNTDGRGIPSSNDDRLLKLTLKNQ